MKVKSRERTESRIYVEGFAKLQNRCRQGLRAFGAAATPGKEDNEKPLKREK